MSKDLRPKTGAGVTPSANKDAAASRAARTGGPAPKPAASPTGKITVSPARTGARPAPSRVSQPVRTQPTGFRLRPLDIGLILLGVLGVGALIWAVLGSAKPQAASSGQTQVGAQSNATPVAVGAVAPDFTLPDTTGKMFKLSDYKGKVVLLEFMAPWCPHCQEDSAIFNQIYDEYQGKNLQILSASASPYGRNHETGDNSPITNDDLVWFRDTYHVKFPLLFDKTADVGRTSYGISSYPTIFVIDGKGQVVAEPDNPPSYEAMKAALDQALGKAAAAPAGVSASVGSAGR